MKKAIIVLLMVATVIGMTMPALANPQVEPIAVAKNLKELFVEVDGAIPTINDVTQAVSNTGSQDNSIVGGAEGGDAMALSGNSGVADSGASVAVVGGTGSGKTMGQNNVNSQDNLATVGQLSQAGAYAGSPTGVSCGGGYNYGYPGGGCSQVNNIYQNENANIYNDQELIQPVDINEWQNSNAQAPASQTITDSMFEENGWTKNVSIWID